MARDSRLGMRLNLPPPAAYKSMVHFPFGNISSTDIQRNYFQLAVLNLGKPKTRRFLFSEYVLAWDIVDESGPLESGVLKITFFRNTEESPYYI